MNLLNAHFVNGETYTKYVPLFVGTSKTQLRLPIHICEVCGSVNEKQIAVETLMKSLDKKLNVTDNACSHCQNKIGLHFNGPELSNIVFAVKG